MQNIAIITLITTCLYSAGASAADYDRRWHGSLIAGSASQDNARNTHTGNAILGFGFGRHFSPRVTADLEFTSYNTHFNPDYIAARGLAGANGEFRVKDVTLLGRYFFGGPEASPFLALGVGVQKHEGLFGNGTNLSASAGVGLRGRVGRHTKLFAQGAFRYVGDDTSVPGTSDFTDFIFTVGFQFQGGAFTD